MTTAEATDSGTNPAEDGGPWPRMIVFAIPLRDALPLPHNSTFTKVLDQELDFLAGATYRATDDGPPAPRTVAPGYNIASLRVWQFPREASTDDKQLLWGFVQRYCPEASPDSHPELDALLDYALAYFRDFIPGSLLRRPPSEMEAAALRDLDARLGGLPEEGGWAERAPPVGDDGQDPLIRQFRDPDVRRDPVGADQVEEHA
jgi:hypothetical protein